MRAAAVLVVLLSLAGCFGGGGDDDSTPTSTTSTSRPPTSSTTTTTQPPSQTPVVPLLLRFSLAPCRGLSIVAAAPLADVQALLPEGFVAAPAAFVPGGSAGAVAVDLFFCDNLTTPNAAVPQTYYGQVYTFIETPSERVPGAPEADIVEYVFRVLAGTDILATLWPAAGYDTYNGTAAVSVGPPVAGLPLNPLQVAQGSVGEGYLLTATGTPNPLVSVPSSGVFARYTALNDGSVLVWTGRYDLPDPAGGQGVLQVPADDPLARFGTPAGTLEGLSRVYNAGGMVEMDLRRVFTAAPA